MEDVIDLLALPLGFLLNQLLGDAPARLHPVRWIAWLIQFLAAPLRKAFKSPRLGGIVLLLLVVGITGGVTLLSLVAAGKFHYLARLALATLLVYYGLAAQSLVWGVETVLELGVQENWTEARRRLSRFVGRDTDQLSPEEVYRACIETLAENATDGIITPLFYAGLAGPVGLWVYKTINTLDAVLRYRNERDSQFGRVSARIAAALNFLPARLPLLLLPLAAYITGRQARHSFRIGWRSGGQHASPTIGWGEAAMAGALEVQLGGTSTYGGVPYPKPHFGEPEQPLTPERVREAIAVMRVAGWLAVGLALWVAVLRIVLVRSFVGSLIPARQVPTQSNG